MTIKYVITYRPFCEYGKGRTAQVSATGEGDGGYCAYDNDGEWTDRVWISYSGKRFFCKLRHLLL